MSDFTFFATIHNSEGKRGINVETDLSSYEMTNVTMMVCGAAALEIPASQTISGGNFVNSISIFLKKGESEGLFAVVMKLVDKRGTFRKRSFLNRVYEKDGKVLLDPHLFVPREGRVIQMMDDGTIYNVIGDVIYTSQIIENAQLEQRLVNGDLLCEYALGKAETEDLLRAVERTERKGDELAETKALLNQALKEAAVYKKTSRRVAREKSEMRSERDAANKKAEYWEKIARRLKAAVCLPWTSVKRQCGKSVRIWRKTEIRLVLEDFPYEHKEQGE